MRDATTQDGHHSMPAVPHDHLTRRVGERLRDIRVEMGLPLGQAAAAAGISRLWAAQIEGGEVLDLATLYTYARVLGARVTVTIENEGS